MLEPGPELDAIVGKNFFGLKFGKNPSTVVMNGCVVGHKFGNGRKHTLKVNGWRPGVDGWWWNSGMPQYSTSIEAAWLVLNLEHPCGWFDGFVFLRYGSGYGVWKIRKHDGKFLTVEPFVQEKTAPHAICLAALKVVGEKVDA